MKHVAEGLKAAGIPIWADHFGRGENWMQEIERELSTAEFLIFFISESSVASNFVMRDIQPATASRRFAPSAACDGSARQSFKAGAKLCCAMG